MTAPEFALGRQLTADFYGCSAKLLADCGQLETVFLDAARIAGATVLAAHFHPFEPQGSSGVVIIAESHFAVHAWPEYGYAAVDIFTCSDRVNFDKAIEALQAGLKAQQVTVTRAFHRGLIANDKLLPEHPVEFRMELQTSTPNWATRFRSTRAQAMTLAVDIYNSKTLLAPNNWRPDIYGAELEMTVRANPDSRTVYVDFFSKDFFEPRPLAEDVLRLFGGSHYKMQVDLRY